MAVIDSIPGGRAKVGLAVGTMLGRYEVLRLLSVGGMAEIYLARAEGIAGFEKLVVIKRMLPHFAMQASYVEMFLAEARLAAMLDHSHIAQVYDIGEETGNYYYAMEYVRGGDLRDLMRIEARAGRAMPIPCAVAIGLGMCAGLDHAHSLTGADGQPLGIVHRDVSLSNVLVSFDGGVKVTDFGVAKMVSSDHRTRTGTLKGKIGYMSPEQCRGQALDRRSDIFSIGIILYELTTGRRLFAGAGSELVVLQKIVGEDAEPPSRLRPDYPPALEEIVLRALQRDRRLRYQSAREMQRDLEALVRAERLPVSPIELGEYVTGLLKPAVEPRAATTLPADDLAAWTDDEPSIETCDPEAPIAARTINRADLAAPPLAAASSTPDLRRSVRRQALVAGGLAAVAAAAVIALWPSDGPDDAPADAVVERAAEPRRNEPAVVAVDDPATEATPPAVGATEVLALAPADAPTPTRVRAAPAAASARDRGHEDPRRGARPIRPPVREPRRGTAVIEARPVAAASDELAVAPEPVAPPVDAAPPIDAAPPPDAGVAARPNRPAPPPAPARPPAPTGSLDAVASLAGVDVAGPLQDSEIRRGAERVLPALRDCYRTAARAAGRTPAGKVSISFEIDETRAARNVRVGGEPLPGLGACVRGAAARIRTRVSPDVGTAQVTIVVSFAPTS